jgi:hypothetical protein
MESIIRDAMNMHLVRNMLIRKSQHGFMQDRSCTTNLLEFLEEATSVVDSGEGFEVVYLDKGETDEKSLSTWHTGTCLGLDQQLAEQKETESGAKWQILHLGGGALRRPPGQCAWTTASVLFINDMDAVVQQINILRKLADDTKLGKTGVTETDRDELQEALNQLCTWADTWGMQFNVAKCTVMHMGHKNPKHVYQMNGQELEVTAEERDIGVMVADNLKPSAQCAKAARTAQSVLGQLTRAFHYRDRHIFIRLYKQYVRPHLEFSTQAWAPWTEADKSCLEKNSTASSENGVWSSRKDLRGKVCRAGPRDPGGEKAPGGHGHGTQDHARQGPT